jgi:hypothetical protein
MAKAIELPLDCRGRPTSEPRELAVLPARRRENGFVAAIMA